MGELFHMHDAGGPNETVVPVPASYISFHLNAPERVIFETATLQIKEVYGVGPNTIWAASRKWGAAEFI